MLCPWPDDGGPRNRLEVAFNSSKTHAVSLRVGIVVLILDYPHDAVSLVLYLITGSRSLSPQRDNRYSRKSSWSRSSLPRSISISPELSDEAIQEILNSDVSQFHIRHETLVLSWHPASKFSSTTSIYRDSPADGLLPYTCFPRFFHISATDSILLFRWSECHESGLRIFPKLQSLAWMVRCCSTSHLLEPSTTTLGGLLSFRRVYILWFTVLVFSFSFSFGASSGLLGNVLRWCVFSCYPVSCIAIIHLPDIHFVYVILESDYHPTLLRLV